jgi:hypothetical protein
MLVPVYNVGLITIRSLGLCLCYVKGPPSCVYVMQPGAILKITISLPALSLLRGDIDPTPSCVYVS